MPKIITDNVLNSIGAYVPVPKVLGTVYANFLYPPFVGFGAVMSTLDKYNNPAIGDCNPLTTPTPILTGVYIDGIPVHYSQGETTCGNAGIGLGEVYCYERIPESNIPVIIPPIFGGGGSGGNPLIFNGIEFGNIPPNYTPEESDPSISQPDLPEKYDPVIKK